MQFSRRNFIKTSAAGLFVPALVGRAMAAEPGAPLPIPDLLDLRGGGVQALDAIGGRTSILQGADTPTIGYNQSYLGPVIRTNRGETARLTLGNKLKEPVSVHWHGLHINGDQDGGPHSMIAPSETLDAVLDIDQPASTLWYHSHIHMRTAVHVWYGLAGMLLVDDPDADDGLPNTYGEDDIPLVVQDRNFDSSGNMPYTPQGPTLMMGYRGSEILVNGAIRPEASVPAGLVRFRILNGSNARIYNFRFEDGRSFQQVATDGGLLPAPLTMNSVVVSPAERIEIVVDFSDGAPARLLSAPDNNFAMRGMARMMASPPPVANDESFEVMRFAVDSSKTASKSAVAASFGSAALPESMDISQLKRRRFDLQMEGPGGGMGGGMGGGHGMSINNVSMDMAVINEQVKKGEFEVWEVTGQEMAHPFHVHGTSFQVLSHNGQAIEFDQTGWKDVVLVNGAAEILVNFNRTADASHPYMYHCHILEHEDLGMMGQFTVS